MPVNNGEIIGVKIGTFPGRTESYLMKIGQTVGELMAKGEEDGLDFEGFTIKCEGQPVDKCTKLEDGKTYYGVKDLKGN